MPFGGQYGDKAMSDEPRTDDHEPDAAQREPLRDAWRRPDPSRLADDASGYEAIMLAHDTASERGEAGYLDPVSGLFVMTAAYLHDQASCCDRGCRHCPYVGAPAKPTAE